MEIEEISSDSDDGAPNSNSSPSSPLSNVNNNNTSKAQTVAAKWYPPNFSILIFKIENRDCALYSSHRHFLYTIWKKKLG